jgi:hypothetical protein
VEIRLHSFLISAVGGVCGQLHTRAALSPGNHWKVCRVDPRASMAVLAKREIPAFAGNRIPVVQLVTSPYTGAFRLIMEGEDNSGNACYSSVQQLP